MTLPTTAVIEIDPDELPADPPDWDKITDAVLA
jgi:hypothetical protein